MPHCRTPYRAAGRYYVQAVLNRYTDYKLANGKVVSLPPDRGEGQQFDI